MQAIINIPEKHDCAMVFGHNPGLSALASYLTGENFNMGTCNTVLLNVETDTWNELSKDTCTVKQLYSSLTLNCIHYLFA